MQSKALTVDAYLHEVPAERLDALVRLRELCRAHLPGYEEAMAYGMPCYLWQGQNAVAFNNQKQYISLYIQPEVLDRHRHQLKNAGKSCVRFSRPANIDWDLIQTLLQETRAANSDHS